MSELNKPKEEAKAYQANVSTHVQPISLDGTPRIADQVHSFTVNKSIKNSEPQGIIINFYSTNYTTRSDKPVQTDYSSADLDQNAERSAVPELKQGREIKQILPNSTAHASESRELRSVDYSPTSFRSSPTYIIHESKPKVLMNTRKHPDNKATSRAIVDLERKKLEAELKATEEIAKIQQTLIEKRLALELASLQDCIDNPHKSVSVQRSLPLSDARVIQEKNAKKHTEAVCKPANESETVENTPQPVQPRPPPQPAPPRPPPPKRLITQDTTKSYNKKPDTGYLSQTSSDFTPLRNLIERKFNLERRSSKISDSKHSSQTSTSNSSSHERRFFVYPDARFLRTKLSENYREVKEKPGSSHGSKARVLWKSAVSKIKKMKPPSKPPSYK